MGAIRPELLALGAAASALLAIVALWKATGSARRWIRGVRDKAVEAYTVLVGTPERRHPLTGAVDPPVPGLVERLAHTDERVARVETAMSNLVVTAAAEAKAAANAAAESAKAAAEASAASRAIAEEAARHAADARQELRDFAAEVRRQRTDADAVHDQLARSLDDLASQVSQWQNFDRVQADTATGVLTELGLDIDLPRPSTSHDDLDDLAT